MHFFKARKARKELKEILHYAKHVRHMHEDIADPQALEQLRAEEKAARAVRKRGDLPGMEAVGEAVVRTCEKLVPPKKHPKIRENVEVLFVAIAAAMAIRAYFFQPFKIPTGSMQPTLYGITIREEPVIPGRNPVARIANLILFGENQKTVRAKTSGYLKTTSHFGRVNELDLQTNEGRTHYTLHINDVPHKIPANLIMENRERLFSLIGKSINKGDILAGSLIKSGDYILVNRFKYNFIRPKRGDIAVFDTRELTNPQVRKDAYYIKRMVGLPGEEIAIEPKHLLVDGRVPDESRFDKIFNDPAYHGYVFADRRSNPPPLLGQPGDTVRLSDEEYFFLGDNTDSSLDGRYFGAVNRRQILGPAFFVCWPLDRAGPAEQHH